MNLSGDKVDQHRDIFVGDWMISSPPKDLDESEISQRALKRSMAPFFVGLRGGMGLKNNKIQ